jgi:hypothetical protein
MLIYELQNNVDGIDKMLDMIYILNAIGLTPGGLG